MDYKKPQDTLVHGGIGLYPLTTADQVILSDGSRLEKDGKINADKLNGRTLAEIMLTLYPVGSVYISANSTSPASLFGGTWESIGGRCVLGADATYAAGSTGGEATHTLTVDEIPPHRHKMKAESTSGSLDYVLTDLKGHTKEYQNYRDLPYLDYTGGGAAHNNMPPYLAVYMWKRVSS